MREGESERERKREREVLYLQPCWYSSQYTDTQKHTRKNAPIMVFYLVWQKPGNESEQ